jgi:hypothetical protein
MLRNNVTPSLHDVWLNVAPSATQEENDRTRGRLQACPAASIVIAVALDTARHSMSLDPSANLQIFSPTGSGRSTPSPRATRHSTEDGMYAGMHFFPAAVTKLDVHSSRQEGQGIPPLCRRC